MPRVEIIGIHPVAADEPVHLVEILVRDVAARFGIAEFTQPVAGQPQSNWQVPYLEHLLDACGEAVIADYGDLDQRPELWRETMRLAFFFHYLDTSRPLTTPFGDVPLPSETPLPKRLSKVESEYDAP